MFVYRLIGFTTDRCRYVSVINPRQDTYEALRAGILRQSQLNPFFCAEKWRIDFLVIDNRKDANQIAQALILAWEPDFNKKRKQIPDNLSEIREWADSITWTPFGTADFSTIDGKIETDIDFPGEKKNQVGSIRTNILLLAALSSGLVSSRICKEICGSAPAYSGYLKKLQQNKEAKPEFGDTPHMVRILKKGCEAIESLVPGATESYLKKRYAKGDLIRKNDVCTSLYVLQMTGAQLIPVRKPPFTQNNKIAETDGPVLAYSAAEAKDLFAKNVKGSRATAVAVTKDTVYLLYHAGARNMRFTAAVENRAFAIAKNMAGERNVVRVLLGEKRLLKVLLRNLKMRGKGGNSLQEVHILPEYGLVFIPTDDLKEAILYLSLMFYRDAEKISLLEEKAHIKGALVNALPVRTNTLPLLNISSDVSILCGEGMEAALKEICPNGTYTVLSNEEIQSLIIRREAQQHPALQSGTAQ